MQAGVGVFGKERLTGAGIHDMSGIGGRTCGDGLRASANKAQSDHQKAILDHTFQFIEHYSCLVLAAAIFMRSSSAQIQS
jgi:hypothetical protein